MSVHFGELAMKFGADGVISPGEVLALRREASLAAVCALITHSR